MGTMLQTPPAALINDQFDEELAWASDFSSTVVVIRARNPSGRAWQGLMRRLERTPRPLLIELLEGAHLGITERSELAEAIGDRVPVALLGHDEASKGTATALRWLGADLQRFEPGELGEAASVLGLDATRLNRTLQALVHSGLF